MGYEDDNYIVSGKKILETAIFDLSNHSKSIIVVRQGSDQGMIDIFNVDKLLGELGKNLKEIFNQWLLNSLNYRNTKINQREFKFVCQ